MSVSDLVVDFLMHKLLDGEVLRVYLNHLAANSN